MNENFERMTWQNGFEATLDDRTVLDDTYIRMTPTPEGDFGRLVLEDTSRDNFEIIRYNRKDAGGVFIEVADGGMRNEDGTSSGIHPRGARVRGNITAQDFREVRENMQAVEDSSVVGFADDAFGDGIVSGGVWSYPATGRLASMTALSAYINGVRVNAAAITNRTFTATRDTYVRLSSAGVISYAEATVGAAEPALPVNTITIQKLTTDTTKFTASVNYNRGVVKPENIDFTSQSTRWSRGNQAIITNTAVVRSVTVPVLAGRNYLVFGGTQQATPSGTGVWQANLRAAGVIITSRRLESTSGQIPSQVIGVYTATTNEDVVFDIQMQRATGTSSMTVEVADIGVVPSVG